MTGSGGRRALDVVVLSGRDAGVRVQLEEGSTVVIGRGRDADLMLTDLSVSRRHLEVRLRAGAISVKRCEGAQGVTVGGRSVDSATVSAGVEIRVGETVLGIVPSTTSVDVANEISEVATLLGGPTEDAKGFAAVFALAETLDGARDRANIESAIAAWATRYLGTKSTVIAADVGERTVRCARDDAGLSLSVPLFGHGALVFMLSAKVEPTEQQRRLAVVAGRICSAALTHTERLERAEAERDSLRSIATGSARAFLGESEAAQAVVRLLPRLAASDATLLLLGETGSGKSFVARLLHDASRRVDAPFRAINCAALPESLIESELFGHERGAFTGAVTARVGAFESAGEGTLFLDEVAELPLASQAKLLRALEEKRFERVGSNRSMPLRARVIAATNRSLTDMVAAGRFRADLYYRLSVVNLEIPALRDRRGDIALLAKAILADLAPSAARRVSGFSKTALEVITSYDWPGNVRELRNVVERAIVLGDGPFIEPADLPDVLRGTPTPISGDGDVVRLPARLADLEEQAIRAALAATGGNRTRAAALLGINRVTLYKKLRDEDP